VRRGRIRFGKVEAGGFTTVAFKLNGTVWLILPLSKFGSGSTLKRSEPGANGGFASPRRVPRQADPGGKIAQRWVLIHGLMDGHLRIRQVTEIGCQAIRLTQDGCRFVTHSEVQG